MPCRDAGKPRRFEPLDKPASQTLGQASGLAPGLSLGAEGEAGGQLAAASTGQQGQTHAPQSVRHAVGPGGEHSSDLGLEIVRPFLQLPYVSLTRGPFFVCPADLRSGWARRRLAHSVVDRRWGLGMRELSGEERLAHGEPVLSRNAERRASARAAIAVSLERSDPGHPDAWNADGTTTLDASALQARPATRYPFCHWGTTAD